MLTHKRSRSATGMTLIEVLIVLAIASFILLVIILAVQQAQRNRRDVQRKNFANRLMASIQEFHSNNRRNPDPNQIDDIKRFAQNYVSNETDPSTGKSYSLASLDPSLPSDTLKYRALHDSHSDIPAIGEVFIQYGHWCNRPGVSGSDDPSDPIAGDEQDPTRYVIWIGTEVGDYYCVDNYQQY